MHRNFLKSLPFRAIFPALYGLFLYSAVLLIFDSLSHWHENFFSLEALLCILMTYVFFESMHWVTYAVERWANFQEFLVRSVFLFAVTLATSYLVSFGMVWSYFTYLLHFQSFDQELSTFNSLFMASAFFYNLVYLSFFYLNERNTSELEKEEVFKEKLAWQFERFQANINPDFLYLSLETLISLVHRHPEHAQEYISWLANYYRFHLESQELELIPLQHELDALVNQAKLLHEQWDGAVGLEVDVDRNLCQACRIVPGSLQRLLQSLVASSVVNQKQPFEVICTNDGDDYLVIRNPLNEKLSPQLPLRKAIETEQKSYQYFTSLPIVQLKAYNESLLKVPLIYPALNEVN